MQLTSAAIVLLAWSVLGMSSRAQDATKTASPGQEQLNAKFSTKGNAKARGVDFSISYPSNWIEEEVASPSIVHRFRSPDTDAQMLIAARKLSEKPLSEERIASIIADRNIVEKLVAPKGGVAAFTLAKIGAVPVAIVEAKDSGEHAGAIVTSRMLYLVIIRGDTLATVVCSVGGRSVSEEAVQLGFEIYRPTFKKMLDSVAFESN